MRTMSKCFLVSCLAITLIGWSSAYAQQVPPPNPDNNYDCVIEPRSLVKLGSADEGILQKITVERGDIVKKGTVVAKLDSELQALTVALAKLRAARDVEIRSGKARLKFRARVAERALALSRKRVISTKSLEEAETESLLAEYGLKAAQMDRRMAQMELKNARTLLERRTIRSPVAGVVVELTMSAGEFAHKQSPIMTIAQVDPLNVEVFVPISHYGSIRTGMEAEVIPEQPVGGKYLAKVSIVDQIFDTASSSFGVRLVLPNPKFRLPAGLKCQIRFLHKVASTLTTPGSPNLLHSKGNSTQSADSLVREIQAELVRAGYDIGGVDGHLGNQTRAAIDAFQRQHGIRRDALPSKTLLSRIRHELSRNANRKSKRANGRP